MNALLEGLANCTFRDQDLEIDAHNLTSVSKVLKPHTLRGNGLADISVNALLSKY